MSKRNKIIIFSAAGVLLLGLLGAIVGPMVYANFIAAPAAEVPTLVADDQLEEAEASSDSVEASGEWSVGSGSYAGYRVDEVLNGTDVTVTGRTEEVTGSLTVNDLTIEAAEFSVDVASIATDSQNRDSYFRDNAIRATENPTATFVLTEPVTLASAPAAGEVLEQDLTGELTLAGVTQTVTFTAQFSTDGTTAEVAGQIPIAFADYGVEAPNLGFVSVEDEGFVEFSLVLDRA